MTERRRDIESQADTFGTLGRLRDKDWGDRAEMGVGETQKWGKTPEEICLVLEQRRRQTRDVCNHILVTLTD